MLQAIVFDFDGVIVDSEPMHYQAFVMVGKSIGFSFTYEQYLAQYIGFDDRDAFRLMLATSGQEPTPDRVAELCHQKQAAFDAVLDAAAAADTGSENADARSIAIPGSLDLIDECHAAGLPIAIASGATHADIDLMLNLLGRRDRFEIVVAADDVERSKPDPASYALAAQRLGVDPASALAIEDTAAGLRSARGAGLRTLALTTTGPAEPLADADRLLPDLAGVTLEQLHAWY
ncbi:MAG: HAD family phosphatase [Planctomycetota bacterium]